MKAATTTFLGVILASSLAAADARYVIDDPYAGYYAGTYKTRFVTGKAEAQVRALGNGAYDGFIVMKSIKDGVEQISWVNWVPEFRPGPEQKITIHAVHPNSQEKLRDAPDERLAFPRILLNTDITPGRMSGTMEGAWFRPGDTSFELARTKAPASPTLGATPPPGAIVVFDGRDRGQWKEAKWKVKDGALEVGEGNITTKQSLTNFLLHLEFRTPHMPEARGQARGNSGVYLRSVFEVQVLDSFGLFPLANNDCGGIYQVQAPDWTVVNACLPPGEWQTYDITYREGDEKAFRLPEITVVHNGKTVLDRVKIPSDFVVNGTGGGEVDGGYLMLQNHGDAVQYRNIWVQPIE